MSGFSQHWELDPDVVFLNHGSFGACPTVVLEAQRRWRDRMEREPVRFFALDLERRFDEAREVIGGMLGAQWDDLAFVPNATTGVNAVLRSITWEPGDELLVTNHAYNACANALRFVADRGGATVVVVDVPFPLDSDEEIVDPILARATEKTKLALIDHITSSTGLVFPIRRIVDALNERGIDTLVDGAHALGHVPLDLDELGAAYYTGNCHKWLCTPKGAAVLHVRKDRQARVRPTVISHGANDPRTDRSRFLIEFDWCGTVDPTAFLTIPDAIRFIGGLLPGGWPEVMQRNHALALQGRRILCDALAIEPPPAPEHMIGNLVALPLPDGITQDGLRESGIEVPVFAWPAPLNQLVRISAQLYNEPADYERLASALTQQA